MVGIPAIRNLIREDKVAQMYSAIQTGQQFGMQTLDQCLQDLVKRGVVSRQEASGYAKSKDLLQVKRGRRRLPWIGMPVIDVLPHPCH